MSKVVSIADAVSAISSGQSIGFGGGGLQRKPMALARAIAASALTELNVCSLLGGPEVDLLLGVHKIKQLQFAFVGFDALGLAPHFRHARESGSIRAVEYSEGMMLTALEAAAKKLPFLPTRFGSKTDLMNVPTSPFREFPCPFTGEHLVAVPAITPDVAFIHANVVDRSGNAVIFGDAYVDPLLVRAARKTFVTAERVVDDIRQHTPPRSTFISRLWVEGVIDAPNGGGFTAVYPDYPFNLPELLEYQKRATDDAWFNEFVRRTA